MGQLSSQMHPEKDISHLQNIPCIIKGRVECSIQTALLMEKQIHGFGVGPKR